MPPTWTMSSPRRRPARGFETAGASAACGLEETAALFPAVRESYQWVEGAARVLKNEEGLPAKKVRRRLVQLLPGICRAAATTERAHGAGGFEAVREGDPELLAGLVWPATSRRFCRGRITTWSTPSAVIATTTAGPAVGVGVAGPGGDGLRAGDLGAGDAAAAGRRLGAEPGLCRGLEGTASGTGGAAGIAAEATPVPPQSRCLPQGLGAPPPPANFASLEKTRHEAMIWSRSFRESLNLYGLKSGTSGSSLDEPALRSLVTLVKGLTGSSEHSRRR